MFHSFPDFVGGQELEPFLKANWRKIETWQLLSVCEQDLRLDNGSVKFDKTEDIDVIDLTKFVYD